MLWVEWLNWKNESTEDNKGQTQKFLRDSISGVIFELYLDDVPRAVIRACNKPVMKMKGFFRVMTKKRVGRITMPWIIRPMMTVTVYMPSCPPISVMSSISTILPAIKKRIPMGAYLQRARIKQGTNEWSVCFRKYYV